MEGKITEMKNFKVPMGEQTEMKFNKEHWGKTGRQPKRKWKQYKKEVKWVTENVIEKEWYKYYSPWRIKTK